MARTPQKACPILFALFDRAETDQIARYFRQPEFERLDTLAKLRKDAAADEIRAFTMGLLSSESKMQLRPLELQAARVLRMEEPRGQYALDGLTQTKLKPDDLAEFKAQKDDLGRCLWVYLHHRLLFAAGENVVDQRLFRNYGKHYETFHLRDMGESEANEDRIAALIADIEQRIDRGKGCEVYDFDFPSGDSGPARKLYLLYHPKPFASAREIRDDGTRSGGFPDSGD